MVERRTYRSVTRAEQARQTRAAVVSAAHELLSISGYAATTMRLVAEAAGVSVPTVEQLFGTKSTLLKACIDVAIAGDGEPVAMLEREWTRHAEAAVDINDFVAGVASVLGPAQARSAALVLAVFEGSRQDPELAELADRLTEQRAVMATWVIVQLRRRQPLRNGLTKRDAIDTVWVLLDPAVYERITLHRGRPLAYYQRWIADSIKRLLFDEEQA
jgi:AcrR family transcriptional regulator